jgi:hypothetical protein
MNTSATYNFILKVEVKKSIGSSSIVLKPLESINAIEYNSKVEPSKLNTVLNEIMGINFVSNRSTIGGKSLSNIQMETSPYTSDFSSILKRSRENTEKTSMTSDTHDKPPKKIHISKPIPMEKKSKRGRPSKSYVENELLNSNNILSIAKKCSIPKRFLSKNDNTYYKDEFLKPVHSTENEIKGYLTQHTKIAPKDIKTRISEIFALCQNNLDDLMEILQEIKFEIIALKGSIVIEIAKRVQAAEGLLSIQGIETKHFIEIYRCILPYFKELSVDDQYQTVVPQDPEKEYRKTSQALFYYKFRETIPKYRIEIGVNFFPKREIETDRKRLVATYQELQKLILAPKTYENLKLHIEK